MQKLDLAGRTVAITGPTGGLGTLKRMGLSPLAGLARGLALVLLEGELEGGERVGVGGDPAALDRIAAQHGGAQLDLDSAQRTVGDRQPRGRHKRPLVRRRSREQGRAAA